MYAIKTTCWLLGVIVSHNCVDCTLSMQQTPAFLCATLESWRKGLEMKLMLSYWVAIVSSQGMSHGIDSYTYSLCKLDKN